MRNPLIIALLGSVLAGCGTTYSTSAFHEAEQRAQVAYADCDSQRQIGALRSYRQAAACAKPKVLAAYMQSGYPYMDLVELELQARATAADHLDTGSATTAQVDRDLTALEHRIADERQRRHEGEMQTGGSAPYQPPLQLLAGLDTLVDRAPAPGSANCFTVGSFSHCD